MSTISRVATAAARFPGKVQHPPHLHCVLFHDLAGCGARHIHGDIAAADHNYLFADRELVAEIHVQQKINAFVNAVEINAGNVWSRLRWASNCQQDRVKTLVPEI